MYTVLNSICVLPAMSEAFFLVDLYSLYCNEDLKPWCVYVNLLYKCRFVSFANTYQCKVFTSFVIRKLII